MPFLVQSERRLYAGTALMGARDTVVVAEYSSSQMIYEHLSSLTKVFQRVICSTPFCTSHLIGAWIHSSGLRKGGCVPEVEND